MMTGIYRAFIDGDLDRAREVQFAILVLVRAMFALSMPLGFKTALNLRGFKMDPHRLHLSGSDPRTKKEYGVVS